MASPTPDVRRVFGANSARLTDNGMANSGSRWAVYAALTAATCFWGVGFAVARFALRSVTPLQLLAGQSLAAALAQIVWILALRRGASLRLPRTLFAVVAALGLLGHNILNGLTFFGLARTTATNAALIYGFSPIMIALLAAWFLREPLGGRAAMAALVGLAGVALIITQGHAGAVRLRGMMAEISSCSPVPPTGLLIRSPRGASPGGSLRRPIRFTFSCSGPSRRSPGCG